MHLFRSLIGGLMVAAVALGLPATNSRRSLSSATEGDDVFIRALEHVKFGPQVSEANKATIEAQVRAHHASLPEGHEQKGAVHAYVYKDYHHSPGEDTSNPQHTTFQYFKAGARNQRNQLGGGVHVNQARREYIDEDGLFTRTLEHVRFGPQVSEANKATIEAQVRAHHASLPDGHAQKGAVHAYVYKDYHHSPGEDTSNPQHTTFQYFKAGARNQRNQLGDGVHVNQAREFIDDDLYTRTLEHVRFGPQVSEENKAKIEEQVRAHHAALPEGHAQKGAAHAYVYKDYHHSPGEDTTNPKHTTFQYFKAGARNQRNQLGGGVHVDQE